MNSKLQGTGEGVLRSVLLVLLGWAIIGMLGAKLAHWMTGEPQPWVYLPCAVMGVLSAVAEVTRRRHNGADRFTTNS